MNSKQYLSLLAITLLYASQLSAQIATSVTALNTNKITIDLVLVGDPNNHGHVSDLGARIPFGSVSTEYQIGKYDVTAEQYCAFLNAVASHSDPHGLYDTRMTTDLNVACIIRSGDETTGYTYQPISDYHAKFPITYVSFFSTLRFCNWLENGQPVGEETIGTTESGAYDIDNKKVFHPVANSRWNLPTENQWYKAAYYQPAKHGFAPFYYGFGNSSYSVPDNNETADLRHREANYCLNGTFTTSAQPRLTPVGTFTHSASPWGAYDMAGNVNQWTITRLTDDSFNRFIARGGSWASTHFEDLRFLKAFLVDANERHSTLGFRIVYNPPKEKPSSSWWWPFASSSESL